MIRVVATVLVALLAAFSGLNLGLFFATGDTWTLASAVAGSLALVAYYAGRRSRRRATRGRSR